jgi:DNA gyrase/topoisomerase IV subunit B
MQNDVIDDVRYWRVITWLDADVDTLHIERISLNDSYWVLSI